jgi:hypothetical protein
LPISAKHPSIFAENGKQLERVHELAHHLLVRELLFGYFLKIDRFPNQTNTAANSMHGWRKRKDLSDSQGGLVLPIPSSRIY